MPSRIAARLAVATVVLLAPLIICAQASAQDRWATIDPNNDASSTMVWATTKDQAERLAIDACKDVSSTCAKTPASTNDMSHVFAIMCCTRPKVGCAAAVAGSRKAALSQVKKTFSDSGYSNCSVKSYINAGSGKKS